MRHSKISPKNLLRACGAAALCSLIAFCSSDTPHAQRAREPEVKVTGVASRQSGGEATVSISADGNLSRAQTWQDDEGFHVVVPRGRTELRNSGAARNVRMQRVGDSLEFVVPVKPGSRVTVQPRFNRLDLVVSGGVQEGTRDEATHAREATAWEDAGEATDGRGAQQARTSQKRRANDAPAGGQGRAHAEAKAGGSQTGASVASPQTPAVNGATADAGQADANPPASAANQVEGNGANADASRDAQGAANEASAAGPKQVSPHTSSSLTASVLVGALSLAGLCVGLFVYRRRRGPEGVAPPGARAEKKAGRAEQKAKAAEEKKARKQEKADARQASDGGDRRRGGDRRMIDRGTPDRRQSSVKNERVGMHHPTPAESGADKALTKPAARAVAQPSAPSVFFGAYRIDQEVAKLASGEAHAIDVLASRAPDDRRAVETSLIKVLRAPEYDETGQRRARRALEEYGFVARQSAALLLAPDAYERASAARVLGEIQSNASLPFLLEALYDPESVVRQEVVASLGALRLPRAIGPLIDLARRYPEMPADMLRPALNACSVETLEVEGSHAVEAEPHAPFCFSDGPFTGEITGLEPPEAVEVLPEWLEDDSLADALERLNSVDVEARTLAAQSLAQFQVQRSVDALAAMSATDREAVVRAAAVTSLGVVNHESVFAPVLMALADDAREVRAAAARALSRLSFNRADAYVRVIETTDAQTLRGVSRACVKAGLAAQAVDRLTSEDRRQAYESFALLSMVVKSGEVGPALDAVATHADEDVRLAVLRLLLMMGRTAELVEPLRRLAARERVPARVRASLMEAVGRIEQAGQREAVAPPAND